MVIFLLAVIAVGVLLLSDVGRTVLGGLGSLAFIALVLGIIAAVGLVAWWAVVHWQLQETIGVALSLLACGLLLYGFLSLGERCRTWWSRRQDKTIADGGSNGR